MTPPSLGCPGLSAVVQPHPPLLVDVLRSRAHDGDGGGEMTETPSFRDLLVTRPERRFAYLDPPFAYNSPAINAYPKELTGYYHLGVMRRRLGWTSYADKVMLDFGCGVRFARTIHNLDVPIGLYVGVDVNQPVIEWFKANVSDPRFRFEHLNAPNTFYNAH